jgi:putative aldouronate transport system permease protein
MKNASLTVADKSISTKKEKSLWQEIKANKHIYFFLLPGIAFLIIFSYVPMYGITLAFKTFMVNKGILGSPWVGLDNFKNLFSDSMFWNAFVSTFKMGFFYILTGFSAPLILAILINEVVSAKFKKTLQTIYTFPNFLSWVVVGGLMINFLSANGVINTLFDSLGFAKYEFLSDTNLIRPLLYMSNVWKGAGWGAIIYLAAIASINPEMYEAAIVDGANRFHRVIYITWPCIKSTAVILLILSFGGIMNNGFDQILNMTNPIVRDSTEVMDTYIYNITFNSASFDYGFSTAAGLFKSGLNFIFLIAADRIAKVLGEGGLF